MTAHHGTSPRAIQRRTLRSMRATWRRAQISSRMQAIASPLCPAGRDMARRATNDHLPLSSLGAACAVQSEAQALRGASAGRATSSDVVLHVHGTTLALLGLRHNEPVPTRGARV